MQDTLPLSLEDAGALTPIVEQSAAELGSEASQQTPVQPTLPAQPSGNYPYWIALKYAPSRQSLAFRQVCSTIYSQLTP